MSAVQPLVSVIVPVYQCVEFLPVCLDSVLAQTERDFELILVNDGSTDGSGELCDRYASSDSRIRVIHQENQGPAPARNRALDASLGRYIALIDADDWLEPEYLEVLLGAIQGQDLAVCGYAREREASEPYLLGHAGPLSRSELLEHSFCTNTISPGCWNKLLRRDLLERQGLRFEPGMPWGDDMLFLALHYRDCQRVAYVNRPLYHYRLNTASIMQSTYAGRRFRPEQGRILDAVDAMAGCFDPNRPEERRIYAYRRVRSSVRLLLHLALCSEPQPALLQRLGRHVRAGWRGYLGSAHARGLERLAAAAVVVSPGLAYRGAVVACRLLGPRLQAYLE